MSFLSQLPAEGPVWLPRFAASVADLFRRVLPAPLKLWRSATASLPPATAENQGSIAWDETADRLTVDNGSAWVTLQPYDAGLAALAAFNTNGLIVQTAADTFAGRTLQAPAAGLTIANPAGTAGDPAFALANDLAALEALTGTSTIYYRSAADTWSAVTIAANLGFAAGTLGSALGTAATKNTGTSGTAVPLLDGINTWSGQQNFTAGLNINASAPIATFNDTDTSGTNATGYFQGRDSANALRWRIGKPFSGGALYIDNSDAGIEFSIGGSRRMFLDTTNSRLDLNSGYVVRINAQQVLGGRLAALPADATDLASVIALANAIKARMKATGGHGLVSD